MMRIVSQAIPSGNDQGYERGLQEAQRGLERAIAAPLAANVSFAEREQGVLAAANGVCRRLLESMLEACGLTASRTRATTSGTNAGAHRIFLC